MNLLCDFEYVHSTLSVSQRQSLVPARPDGNIWHTYILGPKGGHVTHSGQSQLFTYLDALIG